MNDKELRDNLQKLLGETKNELKKRVISELMDSEDLEAFIKDLSRHGCVSGMVGSLIYYTDTTEFYNQFTDEIWDLLEGVTEDYGYKTIMETIANFEWAKSIGTDEQFKNNLAWFAFEEMARIVANKIGIME